MAAKLAGDRCQTDRELREKKMEKFNPDCSDVPSDGFSANITNELKFLENLKYWQVLVNEYKTIYLKCLESERYIEFFEFLRVPESIFLTYDWTTPECFYELIGVVRVLCRIRNKYILHRQYPLQLPLIGEIPQDLLEGIATIYERTINEGRNKRR
ncbi:hypothetical protein F7734_04565 [Scytonema sp. UIC 10036]|uniref:hypothetical protein n=1 Tax=Scytonema sp. UIC 10036 TaxID=2304196 RepID=UPI0012DA19C0|nr:hypothetical protein [Scytonema sp. UIC 10036]MUG91787.1 hypothetical protein [Scytonema sp. UIC 10036]